MIQIAAFTHTNSKGSPIFFELADLTVVGLEDDFIVQYEFDLIFESLIDLTDDLKPEEWHRFDFKRVYDDDGSGQKNQLWFDMVKSQIIEEFSNPEQ